MDSRWFKEDREQARADKSVPEGELREESKKALKNSTLFQRRLDRIIDDLIDESDRADEDFTKPNWQLEAVAGVSRRKALGEIKRLIKL